MLNPHNSYFSPICFRFSFQCYVMTVLYLWSGSVQAQQPLGKVHILAYLVLSPQTKLEIVQMSRPKIFGFVATNVHLTCRGIL